jgi:hypothetical protein
VKFDPVIVARQLWEQTRLNAAPGNLNIGASVAGATAQKV